MFGQISLNHSGRKNQRMRTSQEIFYGVVMRPVRGHVWMASRKKEAKKIHKHGWGMSCLENHSIPVPVLVNSISFPQPLGKFGGTVWWYNENGEKRKQTRFLFREGWRRQNINFFHVFYISYNKWSIHLYKHSPVQTFTCIDIHLSKHSPT